MPDTELLELTVVNDRETLQVVLSPLGIVEKLNDACGTMTGFAEASVRGKLIWEVLLPADYKDAVRDAVNRLRQGEAMVRLESPLRTRQGEPLHVAWTFTIVQRDDGRLQSIVGHGEIEPPAARTGPADEREQKNQAVLAALEQRERTGPLAPLAVVDDLPELQPHQLQGPPKGSAAERRTQPRREYPYVQRIAPWGGGRLPSVRAFFDVRCRDISASGISFYVPIPPGFKRFVMGLGTGEKHVHVIAEVKHVAPSELDGQLLYLVGSQFLARVYY